MENETGQDVKRATHIGVLEIGNIKIRCAVLEDGTRILSRESLLRAIGRTGNPKKKETQLFQLPTFLRADNLKDFIQQGLIDSSNPILFRPVAGRVSYGYKADILPLVCNVFLDAADAKVLRPIQNHIYERCKILMRGFAVVGITALVDEATGYQEVRDRMALQAILDKFLRRELAVWARRFPDEFYREMFRLRGWQWHQLTTKRPSLVGHFTNDLVYERLAPGLLEELQRLNPKDEKGHRKAKHHQWLTEDLGHPALAQHLYAVIGFMRASTTWDQFYRMVQRAFPKRNTTLLLPMPDSE
jgi:P63C domain